MSLSLVLELLIAALVSGLIVLILQGSRKYRKLFLKARTYAGYGADDIKIVQVEREPTYHELAEGIRRTADRLIVRSKFLAGQLKQEDENLDLKALELLETELKKYLAVFDSSQRIPLFQKTLALQRVTDVMWSITPLLESKYRKTVRRNVAQWLMDIFEWMTVVRQLLPYLRSQMAKGRG